MPSWDQTDQGKSTLAKVLLGHPGYEITAGTIRFKGEDVTHWPTDVRGKAGMFLAFQDPESIGGVPVIQFLRQALSARRGWTYPCSRSGWR